MKAAVLLLIVALLAFSLCHGGTGGAQSCGDGGGRGWEWGRMGEGKEKVWGWGWMGQGAGMDEGGNGAGDGAQNRDGWMDGADDGDGIG